MIMPGRNFNSNSYRYGAANGQEKVDEISGSGNHYTAEFWEYDPRLIWRWNTDPVVKHHLSPYNCYSGNPIWKIDPNGADDDYYNTKGEKTKTVERSWVFELFFGNRSFITSDKGNSYLLGKQGLDVLKSGKFTGLVEDWETTNRKEGLKARVTEAATGYNPNKENVLNYTLRESQDKTPVEGDPNKQYYLNQKTRLDANKLYVFAGKALNRNEAGNVVWGATMRVFGMDPFGTYFSAHGGTYMLKGRLDERDESSATFMGSSWMQNTQDGRTLLKLLTIKVYGDYYKKNYGIDLNNGLKK